MQLDKAKSADVPPSEPQGGERAECGGTMEAEGPSDTQQSKQDLEAGLDPVGHLENGPGSLRAEVSALRSAIETIGEQVRDLARQVEVLQGGTRQLRGCVADAATSLSAPRMRELYMRLLLMYDLVAPPPAHLSDDAMSFCGVLARQIEQFLGLNGFERIRADGVSFDKEMHKPAKFKLVDDPALHNRVISTVQQGFMSEHGLLRPAIVVVGSLREQSAQQAGPLTSGMPTGSAAGSVVGSQALEEPTSVGKKGQS